MIHLIKKYGCKKGSFPGGSVYLWLLLTILAVADLNATSLGDNLVSRLNKS